MFQTSSSLSNRKSKHLYAGSETNTAVGCVKHGVVLLDELLSNDAVDARRATIIDPCVVLARREAEFAVLGSWDQVLSWGKGVAGRAELDGEVGSGLGGVNRKARGAIGLTAGSGQEVVVRRSWNVDEGRARVNNAGLSGGKGRCSVGEAGNRNTPVWRSSAAGELREVGEGTSVLGSIDTTKGQLAVSIIVVAAGLWAERYTENLGGNRALRL